MPRLGGLPRLLHRRMATSSPISYARAEAFLRLRSSALSPVSTFASGAAGQPRVEIGLIGKVARRLKQVFDRS